jgi:hypothetical protein
VPDAIRTPADTSRLVCRRSSVDGPGSPLIPAGTTPSCAPESGPDGLILGVVSDIKFFCRR